MLKDDNVIYPPLVEQAYSLAHTHNVQITKAETYKAMIAAGMIDQQGKPTRTALDTGLIEKQPLNSFQAFLAENPVFIDYDRKHFQLIDGRWCADLETMLDVAHRIIDGGINGNKHHAQQLIDQYEK